jgi:peptidoglycan/LPS O-acetylase OafA/YrhL
MGAAAEIGRFGRHRNAFGLMRLLLAMAVVLSHTPEIIDGNRGREPLVRLFGTISLGDLAVDGFFLISGYLITGSFLKRRQPWIYLRNRIARIYPGFVVASLVCLTIVAPLAAGMAGESDALTARSLARVATLQRPEVPGLFAGTFHPTLNNPMWTIAYEFRCYLLVLLLGAAGLLRRTGIVLGTAVAMLGLYELVDAAVLRRINEALPHSLIWLGFADHTLRLSGVFLFGAWFFLCRASIRFTRIGFVLATLGLAGSLSVPALADLGAAAFGGYLLLGLALCTRRGPATTINNKVDISYGTYLYAWPIAKLLLWYWPALPIWSVNLLTLAAATVCGWVSWHLIERPALRWAARPGRVSRRVPAPTSA